MQHRLVGISRPTKLGLNPFLVGDGVLDVPFKVFLKKGKTNK